MSNIMFNILRKSDLPSHIILKYNIICTTYVVRNKK